MLGIFARTRGMDLTTVYPLRGTRGSLACPASAFLLPRLLATAGYLAACLGLVRAQAGIRHLLNIGLVHQIHIHLSFEDLGRQLHSLDLFTLHVENIHFHRPVLPLSALTACARPVS